jgi:hypothetical protein
MKRAAASLAPKINMILPCISQVDIPAFFGKIKSLEDFEQMIARGPPFNLEDLVRRPSPAVKVGLNASYKLSASIY